MNVNILTRTRMQPAKKINSFESIILRLEKAHPGSIETHHTNQTSDYPLIKMVLGKGNPRRVLISAGIHGDEPGSVESLLSFLENNNYAHYINNWEITVLPCINPHGYEFGTRENHQGKDLNRLFKEDDYTTEVIFAQSILNTPFELTIELHEDNETTGYYLYQKGIDAKDDELGYEILDKVKNIMPINLDGEIDGSSADRGVIGKDIDISTMDWWPMALYGLSKGVERCLTLETASHFDMETRVNAHLTAIKTALNYFSNKR
jgi:murein peptide amidase A